MTSPAHGVRLLTHAERFLAGRHATVPNAAFSAALLAREALEWALRAWAWQALAVDLRGVNGRAQLAVIEEHVRDREIARRARFAWHELSALLHHGPGLADPATVARLCEQTRMTIGDLAADLAARATSAGRHANGRERDRA